jgi:hypothetical protein
MERYRFAAVVAALSGATAVVVLVSPSPATVTGHNGPIPVATGSALPGCALGKRRFHTHPDFLPVGLCVRRHAGAVASGYLLVTPRPIKRPTPGKQFAAMILSNAGRVLWYSPRPNRVHDLKTVRYRGKTLLALYERGAHGAGSYELVDRHYRVVTHISTGRGFPTDSHELQLTPQGTAYVGSYHRVMTEGAGLVTEYVVRELDLNTRKALFTWHSLDHVSLASSYVPRPTNGQSWDYFHGNSIQPPAANGRIIIISSRNTSAIYGIDRNTGAVRWRLGGKHDEFGIVERHPAWRFCGQHDARRLANGDIMLFDNGGKGERDGTQCRVHAARVEQFRLDYKRMTARRVQIISSRSSSETGGGYFTRAVGSARRQPNGSTLINWGGTGEITEVTAHRRVVLRVRLEPWTYRAIRARWVGLPLGRPAVKARRHSGRSIDVWASWNGATQISRWEIIMGSSPEQLRPEAHQYRFADFETHMRVSGTAGYVAVRALNARDQELGRSTAVAVR